MNFLSLIPSRHTFRNITTRSFHCQVIKELYHYDIASEHNHQYYHLEESDGVAFNHYHLFHIMNYDVHIRNEGTVTNGTASDYIDEVSVVEPFVNMVYQLFAPLVFFVHGDDQDIDLETFEELNEDYYKNTWKSRRRYESTLLEIVKSIVRYLNSQNNAWLKCQTDSVNDDYNLHHNDESITMPHLSMYCIFNLFYRMLSHGFIRGIYNEMIGSSNYFFEHPSMHSAARDIDIMVKKGKTVIMSNVSEVIDNIFDELNMKAQEPEAILTKREIDGTFERHIKNQLDKFRKEKESYHLKQLTNQLHVKGRQTKIPASVTALGGPISKYLASNNTIKNAKYIRNQQRATTGGAGKTLKARKKTTKGKKGRGRIKLKN